MFQKINTQKILFASLGLVLTGIGHAQSIRMSTEPFAEKPLLPFAPPQGVSTQAPAVEALPIAPLRTFQLEKGKRVDEQLTAYGRRDGWTLVWQAPDYVLDQPMTLQGDFEASVVSFLRGANEAGIRLRATFYRGNKTVRVTEF